MATDDPTNPERQAKYRARRERQGWKRLNTMLPPEEHARAVELIEKMRAERPGRDGRVRYAGRPHKRKDKNATGG